MSSTSVSALTTNFFPSAQDGFQTTLASTISSGVATVPLNSVAGYTNGQVVVMIVDPSNASLKQAFTGVVDTVGIQITSVVWTSGVNQIHSGGATVVDYETATHWSMVAKGIQIAHNQDGTHKSGATYPSPVFSGTATGTYTLGGTPTISSPILTGTQPGWITGLATPNTVTYNGNRSYSCVFNSTDLTGIVSAGMRLKTTRSVAAPTQCTSLNGSTQYYSKTSPAGMTFTDDFTVMGWIKLASYTNYNMIISRASGTSGWRLYTQITSGQVTLDTNPGGTGRIVTSYQSIPLNKWVHVAASLDASGASGIIYFDGVAVPSTMTGSGTTLTQAGNLNVGTDGAATLFMTGKIAQAAVFSSVLSQSTIQSYISQGLLGTESTLVSAYSFNNSINDLNANANNLTANGSAVATNADSPFGGQAGGTISSTLDYALVTDVQFSTNTTVTVRVPDVNTIPTSGGVSAVSYSTSANPYGFPGINKNVAQIIWCSTLTTTATATGTQLNGATQTISVPTGGRAYIMKVYFPQIAASANQGVIQLLQNGTIIEESIATGTQALHNYLVTPSIWITAGSQTFTLDAFLTGAGTLTLTNSANQPAFFSIEEANGL